MTIGPVSDDGLGLVGSRGSLGLTLGQRNGWSLITRGCRRAIFGLSRSFQVGISRASQAWASHGGLSRVLQVVLAVVQRGGEASQTTRPRVQHVFGGVDGELPR